MVLKKENSSKGPKYEASLEAVVGDLLSYHSLSSATEAQSSDDSLSFFLLSEPITIHKTLSVSSNLKCYTKSCRGEFGYILFKVIRGYFPKLLNMELTLSF